MRWLELRVPPLFVWVVFAGAMFGVARLVPTPTFKLPGASVYAIALVVLGAAVALVGVVAFRRAGTTVNPITPSAAGIVVSGGIYRFTRNPMYLGFLVALAGWAIQLSNVAAALLLPAFVAYMTRFQIKPEEQALAAKFGPQFMQYRSRVRRWV
ncbi:isoprenylcysteine carboxylmethyltransferase family protein [Humisphaera borealis]|uniref:Isoprenylcysteine carboxylmethyltransferase family protein n=2 Tax=Humisphaera borealis TaxID=2807512 RepID=A0A7M2X436_9BACT|nr:isoprenylcysteine carboxylmethyltransferase family protein [Humisphaera borealis]